MANNNSGRDKNEKDLVCSFCGKHQDEVERMIIGPGVNICSECIGLCADLLSDKPDHQSGSRPSRGGASRARIQATDGLSVNIKTPAEIKEGLDQYVIGQDEAKRVIPIKVPTTTFFTISPEMRASRPTTILLLFDLHVLRIKVAYP